MRYLAYAVVGILALGVLAGLAFTLEIGGLQWKSYFAPKHEAVRREVFKETRSFNEAKIQQLTKYRLEYLRAETEADRSALASTIRHMFADYKIEMLPAELQAFLKEILYGV